MHEQILFFDKVCGFMGMFLVDAIINSYIELQQQNYNNSKKINGSKKFN